MNPSTASNPPLRANRPHRPVTSVWLWSRIKFNFHFRFFTSQLDIAVISCFSGSLGCCCCSCCCCCCSCCCCCWNQTQVGINEEAKRANRGRAKLIIASANTNPLLQRSLCCVTPLLRRHDATQRRKEISQERAKKKGKMKKRRCQIQTQTDLVDFLLVSGSVEFLGDHESCVVGLQEALLVGPWVQVTQTLVHSVHAHLAMETIAPLSTGHPFSMPRRLRLSTSLCLLASAKFVLWMISISNGKENNKKTHHMDELVTTCPAGCGFSLKFGY